MDTKERIRSGDKCVKWVQFQIVWNHDGKSPQHYIKEQYSDSHQKARWIYRALHLLKNLVRMLFRVYPYGWKRVSWGNWDVGAIPIVTATPTLTWRLFFVPLCLRTFVSWKVRAICGLYTNITLPLLSIKMSELLKFPSISMKKIKEGLSWFMSCVLFFLSLF